MQYIEIEYNQELKALEAVLSDVKHPGDFFVCGAIEIAMPRVEVEGAGTLSFPVPDAHIASIVRRAERAPYGRGEETIVETSVRNVWQIAPGKVRIGGKSWAANFENILSKVKAGLGCDESVSAELYKLLVYDRGGFFLAHRDTEKTHGMFGTLVVTLPSMCRGGALRIRHAGREVTVDTNAADPSELSYVAFYADCEHEALPLREGNRICLVYNLIQKHSKGRNRILKAPVYESRILREAVASSYDGSENTALLASMNVSGDAQASAILSIIVSTRMPERPNECTELVLALSRHFHKYTHVLFALKSALTYGILSGGVHFAAIKPVLYRIICAGKARTAPPGRKIYVTVFRGHASQDAASCCRWPVQ